MSPILFAGPAEVHTALSALSDIRDPRSLRVNLVQTIASRLISAEDGSLDHVDYAKKSATWDSIRPLPGEATRIDACCRHFESHPVLQMHQVSTAPVVLRLSDLLTLRKFEHYPLYQELYRPIGMKYLMLLRLGSGERFQTITLLRSDRDFSDREVKLFRTIAPLAIALSKVASERDLLRHALATVAPGRGIILLNDDAVSIEWANPCAQQQMVRFFRWKSQDILPLKIVAWLTSPTEPLWQATDSTRLKVTTVHNGQQQMLLCDELPAEPAPHLLQKLGLTPRQAEVLFWLSRGKTNSEIGIILGNSVHTINRHVEAIFQRLGVESRSAAMVAALEILGV